MIMMKLIIFFLVTSCFLLVHGANLRTYQENVELEPYGFKMSWNVTSDSDLILMVRAPSSKWLGFGLSSDQSQSDLDVFVFWEAHDRTGHFSNRYRKNGGKLMMSKSQGWFLDNVQFLDNFVYLEVHRRIKTCDLDKEHIDVHLQGNRVVFFAGDDFEQDSAKPWKSHEVNILQQSHSEGKCAQEPTPITFDSVPTTSYSNYVDLFEGIYRFYWNFTETDLTGEIHCKTKGWVGFGLSPNGKMDKSDVVVGWIEDDGHVSFTDRHIEDRAVLVDASQDWHLLAAKEENGFTIFKFTRKIVSCDPDDRVIEAGSPHVIFSYGTADPKPGSDISYHGASNRGTKQVLLISGPVNKEQVVDDAETVDFLIENVVLPPVDSTYYCKLMKVPENFTQKRHIFKWELLMPKLNVDRIHHMLVYECPMDLQVTQDPDGYCFTNPVKNRCKTISFGWAVGADLTHHFPPDTGYPIGGDTNYNYFYVEIHYDNPEEKLGYLDSIGVRYHLTKNLRKNELGILTVGADSSPYAITIPPGSERYELTSHCYQDCTGQLPHNINIILAMPHTHLVGTGLITTIVREGKEVDILHQNKYYDFNFQSVYRLDPPTVIKPGDELITKCFYNTEHKKKFTFGGEATYEEMCFYFYTYYPRVNGFSMCGTVYSPESLVELAKDLVKENYTTISQAASGDKYEIIYETVEQLKNKTSASPAVHRAYDKFLKKAEFNAICNMKFDDTARKAIRPSNTFVEKDICKDTVKTTPRPSTTSAAARPGPVASAALAIGFIFLKAFIY